MTTIEERNAMAVKWMGLPLKVYQKMLHLTTVRRMGGDEAKGVGTLALLKAAETWDPERGVPFKNYACFVIRNEILSAAIEHHSGPTRMPRTARLNRSSEAAVCREIACRTPASLSYRECVSIVDHKFAEEEERKELPKAVEVLKILTPTQRRIMEMKLINGMTYPEIVKHLDKKITKQAVSWQYHKALKLLKGAYVDMGYA